VQKQFPVSGAENNAPINIKPHYPPPGRTWGNSGGFDPILLEKLPH